MAQPPPYHRYRYATLRCGHGKSVSKSHGGALWPNRTGDIREYGSRTTVVRLGLAEVRTRVEGMAGLVRDLGGARKTREAA